MKAFENIKNYTKAYIKGSTNNMTTKLAIAAGVATASIYTKRNTGIKEGVYTLSSVMVIGGLLEVVNESSKKNNKDTQD